MYYTLALRVDILTIIYYTLALKVDISTIIQQALVSKQLDILIEIYLEQNFKVNTENRGYIAFVDVQEPKTFSSITTNATTL